MLHVVSVEIKGTQSVSESYFSYTAEEYLYL
jgi:hypothetical protein